MKLTGPLTVARLARAAVALATATAAFGLIAACSGARLVGGPPEPFPGNGPHGMTMPTVTETAVGLPPAAAAPIYPITARTQVSDSYFGVKVADPYRWLENLDSPAVRGWVAAQNALSQSRLTELPARAWVKARLTQLWNYERYDVPVKRGSRYFYLYDSGGQDQSVLMVADSLAAPGRVLFDPNTVREDATVSLSEFTPDVRGDLVAYALSDAGSDWQVWRFRRVADAADLADTLRFTKFWGVSWARDDSGVYYSRYPALPDGRGDDSGRPAVYFHKLGTPQDEDRLVYEVANHPTHIPMARVTEDGHYLVVTLVEGYEKNAVELINLHRPGDKARPLFPDWDGLYTYLGVHGHELYFQSTHDAPLGHVLAVDARDPTTRRIVVHEGDSALEEATYVGGRIIAKYVENAHGVARVYERDGRPVGEVPLPGLGRIEGFSGEGAQSETFFSYTDYLTPRKIFRFDVPTNQATLWREPHTQAATAQFVTEQVFFTSKDGTRVPMY
ncbi:MAG TPA: hypothetical protein VEC10_11665, partial [Steroidobacteraceae bacterium]|nr:hypothetical protein [Steroidobacteraceae bacterium]